MADRSMLFAARAIPRQSGDEVPVLGLSEFGYGIPTLYKLLISVNPTPCPSLIFDVDTPTAIAGSLKGGLERLKALRAQLNDDAAGCPSLDEAIAYLDKSHIDHPYLLLEPGEIFGLVATPFETQMTALLAEVGALRDTDLVELAQSSSDPEHWASGCWSDILYYEPPGSERPPISADTTFLSTTMGELLAQREALASCAKLSTVYLTVDCDQASLAEALLALGQIPAPFALTLQGRCERIPDSVGKLTNVTTLVLGALGIRTFPDEVANLPNLESLFLQTNGLNTVPEFIRGMRGLKQLSLRQNPLRTLPQWIGELSTLENLWLDGCDLEQLPDEFWNLRNLKVLVLSENPKLRALSPRAGDLEALEELNVYDCGLQSLPESVCRLARLRTLWLAKNNLTELPRCLYSMPLDTLSLIDNPLRSPAGSIFGGMPKFRARTVHLKQPK